MATTRALSHGNLRAVIVLPLLFMLVYGHMAVGLSFLVSARRPSDSLADTAWHFPIYKIGGVERRFLKRGYGGFGALGHYVYHRELLPRKVNGPWEGKISHIATSGAHTAAITDSGELYTWGCDEGDGRLGLGSGGGPGEAGSLSVPSKPPWGLENGGAFIIHYTYGCDYDMKGKLIYGKVGECRFDKRSYDSKPPRNLPLPQNGIPQSVDISAKLGFDNDTMSNFSILHDLRQTTLIEHEENHPKICEAGQCMHRGTNYGRLGLLSFQEYTLMNMAF
uniref:Hydroxyproline O-arabinosyltransferase-like domain-containing protein n=1 Tax=Oryza glumipatula TaxID=40148 RepID=A0A0E0BHD8_9ORYZ